MEGPFVWLDGQLVFIQEFLHESNPDDAHVKQLLRAVRFINAADSNLCQSLFTAALPDFSADLNDQVDGSLLEVVLRPHLKPDLVPFTEPLLKKTVHCLAQKFGGLAPTTSHPIVMGFVWTLNDAKGGTTYWNNGVLDTAEQPIRSSTGDLYLVSAVCACYSHPHAPRAFRAGQPWCRTD